MSASGVWAAARKSADRVAFGTLMLVVLGLWLDLAVHDPHADWAFDFRQFWQGANDVVNGDSPYPSAALLATAGDHLDPEGIQEVFRFPYPAGAAVALAPFGALGFEAAAAVWSALLIGSLVGAVWLLGARDWRVLGVVLTSAPVITSVLIGTLTPVLLLLAAVVWRWRDRSLVAGGALALAISLKLFLWPLALWLAATRRYAAAAIAAGLAVVGTIGAWAAIGFEGLARYPELVRRLTEVVADRGLSLVALGVEVGLPRSVADLLPWLVGLSLLGAVVALARREGSDRRSFGLAIVAAIALTPIVWLHYLALLVVPLALARPRFSWPWLLMWVFWLTPAQGSDGALWRLVLAASVVAATALALRRREPMPSA